MTHLHWYLLLPGLLLQAGVVLAQDNEEDELALIYGDRSTVAIATGSRQPLRRAPAVASVITAEDIAAMGAIELDQVLATVPGLSVSRVAGFYGPVYSMRGIGAGSTNTPQILVMQNGVPMTTMYTGEGNRLGRVPLENIARIEIIRGPGSALYGADAYGGVINLITKSALDTAGTQAGLRAGAFNTRDGWVQHGGKMGAVDVAAYLRVGATDGFKEILDADAQSRNDKLFGTHASLAPGPVNNAYDAVDASLDLGYEKWRFHSGYRLRDNMGTGAGVSSALDPAGRNKNERFHADLAWSDPQFAPNWGVGVASSYFYNMESSTLTLFPAGARFPTGVFPDGMIGGPTRRERQIRLSAHATYSGLAGHNLRLGAGHDDLNLYKTATNKNYLLSPTGVPIPTGPVIDYNAIQPHILPQRRKLNYLYVQDEWQFAQDWTLTAGIRRDAYSDFGGTTNPRLALVWDAAYNLTGKLLYGRAFRAPSFNEQYGINPVANGNPSLRPETIHTLEAALSWLPRKDIELNLNLFRYEMKDIIRPIANLAPAPGITFQNAGNQNGRGLELELAWAVNKQLRLSGNYAYQHSIDESSNADPGYAPHHHLYARADWRFAAGWMLSPQINWVADRKRAVGDNRPQIADYKSADLTLRTAGGKGQWDFVLGIQNLFNADVREPSLAPGLAIPNDLPMAPRGFYLQAMYKM